MLTRTSWLVKQVKIVNKKVFTTFESLTREGKSENDQTLDKAHVGAGDVEGHTVHCAEMLRRTALR